RARDHLRRSRRVRELHRTPGSRRLRDHVEAAHPLAAHSRHARDGEGIVTFPLPPRGLVGMVHLAALPGTPRYRLPVARIVDRAVNDARALEAAGFDAVIVENMGDVPYLARTVGPEIVACMTAA